MRKFLLAHICFLFALTGPVLAQTYSIFGKVADAKDTSAMPGVVAMIKNGDDTSIATGQGTTTDANGRFKIDGLAPGNYVLHLEYLGYKPKNILFSIIDKNFRAGIIAMHSVNNELKSVTVEGKQIRAEQSGDTTSFRADAFKVNRDATTEDLITKMPGITSDNTGVKVHGEQVQQVYVDGKPFFGTDPTLSVRNLPAEVVDQIQVYDQLSDQALFTGFDDGNSQKTMNVITRRDKRQGEFGKIFGGYGTDDKYNAGFSLNSFHGDRRISIIETSNNINAQNFSSQDILGVSGGGQGNNFLTGQQNGITTLHTAGINYSDQWGPKVKVTTSYFFNYADNNTITNKSRDYTSSKPLTEALYNENDNNTATNYNHRFSARLEYTRDSFNSLVFTPALSLQNNYGITSQSDSALNTDRLLLSNAYNGSLANNTGFSLSGNLVLRHKFQKKGRTISLNISNSNSAKSSDGNYNTLSASVDSAMVYPANPTRLYQFYNAYNNSNNVSTNLSYTEPLGKISQLAINYNPAVTYSKVNSGIDTINNDAMPSVFDSVLSNKYNSRYFTQKGGISYRLSNKNLNLMFGTNLQYAVLTGDQTYPTGLNVARYYTNLLPIALFNYKFKNGKNLRIMYRTNISAPSISQLQNLINVNNPLQLSTGNSHLRQDYEQTLILRYGQTKKKTAHNFFAFGYLNYINNYMANATYTPFRSDSSLGNGIYLKPGGVLTAPVNLNEYVNSRLNMTYGIPFDIIKSNLNFTAGMAYTHTPGEVNYQPEYSDNFAPTGGVVVSSNISEKVDFTLSYTGAYNFVKNSLQVGANNNYYNHNASFKINWIFLKGFVFNTNIANAYYSTLSTSSGNVNFYLWTTYVGYKFLKDRSLEARITVFDMLNQNQGVSRIVAANYVENDINNILKQYAMFQLTYTLRNFKGAIPTDENPDGEHRHNWGDRPGGGGWSPGGGGGWGGGSRDGGGM